MAIQLGDPTPPGGNNSINLGGVHNAQTFPVAAWGNPLGGLTAFSGGITLLPHATQADTINPTTSTRHIFSCRMEQQFQSAFNLNRVAGAAGATAWRLELRISNGSAYRIIQTVQPVLVANQLARIAWRWRNTDQAMQLWLGGVPVATTVTLVTTIPAMTADPVAPIEIGALSNMDQPPVKGAYSEAFLMGTYLPDADMTLYTTGFSVTLFATTTNRIRYYTLATAGPPFSADSHVIGANGTTHGHITCEWTGFVGTVWSPSEYHDEPHPAIMTVAPKTATLGDTLTASEGVGTASIAATVAPTLTDALASSETVAAAVIPSPYPAGYVRQMIEDGPSLPVEQFEMAEREDKLGRRSGQVILVSTPAEMTQALLDIQPGGDIVLNQATPIPSGTWNLTTKAVTDATPRMPPPFALRPITQATPVRRPTR